MFEDFLRGYHCYTPRQLWLLEEQRRRRDESRVSAQTAESKPNESTEGQISNPPAGVTPDQPEHERRISPGLDALRVFVIIGVICWHALLPYATTFTWFLPTDRKSFTVDGVMWLLLGFRVETFFFVSGFLIHLSCRRRGFYATAQQRLVKLGVPLFAGSILFCLFLAVTQTVLGDPAHEMNWTALWTAFHLRPYHLWFLYYLVLMSFAVVAVASAVKGGGRLGQFLKASLSDWLDPSRMTSIVWLFPPTCALMWWANGVGAPRIDPSFVNPPMFSFSISLPVLGYYGMVFAVGWVFAFRPAVLDSCEQRWVLYLGTSIVARFATLLLLIGYRNTPLAALTIDAVSAIQAWSMMFGQTGWFLHFVKRKGTILTFLASSMYWCYLTHLVPEILIQRAASLLGLPIGLEYLVVVTGTLATVFLSYAYLVRGSPILRLIGRVSRSPRADRGAPALADTMTLRS